MDRRISKTQRALVRSTYRLLANYAWRDVSISMLCDEANISRSTFYSHFATKADLTEQIFCWAEIEFTAESKKDRGLDINGKFLFFPEFVRSFRRQKKMFKRQEKNGSGILITSRTRLMIANMMRIEAERSKIASLFGSRNLTFLSGGVSSVIWKWAEENYVDTDDELVLFLDRYVSWFLAMLKGESPQR